MKKLGHLFLASLFVSVATFAVPEKIEVKAQYQQSPDGLDEFSSFEAANPFGPHEGKTTYFTGGRVDMKFNSISPALQVSQELWLGKSESVEIIEPAVLNEAIVKDPDQVRRSKLYQPTIAGANTIGILTFQASEVDVGEVGENNLVVMKFYNLLRNQKAVTLKYKNVKTSSGEIIPEVILKLE